ncbi:MAG TPA: hypothetical protein VK548_11205 [Candidatus Acidoferrum sp.]|nr:hypothetical protein [Candidatus Acidoferrum sp.]
MCNPVPVRNWLIAILAAIFLALATIVGAAIANGSWFYTYLSPGGMALAGLFSFLATLFCYYAIDAVDELSRCTGSRCEGESTTLRSVIAGVRIVLGIQTAACVAVAAYAWIPGAAQPAMWVIIGTLALQTALIIGAIYSYDKLATCALAGG